MTQGHTDGPLVTYHCDTIGCPVIIEIDTFQGSVDSHGWVTLLGMDNNPKHYCRQHAQATPVRFVQTPEMTTPLDLINHPPHYTSHPSGVECLDIIKHMDYRLGSVIKYLWRAGLKDGNPTLQDLKKAQWYLNSKIADLEKEQP